VLALAVATWLVVHLCRVPLACSRQVVFYKAATMAAANALSKPAGAAQARRNLEGLLALERRCPPDVDLSMMAGANAMVLGRPELAVTAYRRALAVEGRPEVYLALGQAQLAARHETEAVDSFTLAARFNPHVLDDLSEPVAAAVRERLSGSTPVR
jgi:tetratricopeptide (TPR) repeat protein